MRQSQIRWVILLVVSLIWGSSYILMKWALLGLSPVQVGALRMVFAAVFLTGFGWKKLKTIKSMQWKYIFYNAMLGTFFPVFLFTYAVLHVDSGIVAVLNSTTPLFTLVLGILFFRFYIKRRQLFGVILGFAATLWLIIQSAGLHPEQDYLYALPVLLASIGYALNVNILKKYLNEVDALAIATGNFLIVLPAGILILLVSEFPSLDFSREVVYKGIFFTAILAFFGTALAKVLFNRLIQISSPVFSSSVTYTIPLVALLWGAVDGERFFFSQIIAGIFIILGVILTGRGN